MDDYDDWGQKKNKKIERRGKKFKHVLINVKLCKPR
jgi:hypothetical protein